MEHQSLQDILTNTTITMGVEDELFTATADLPDEAAFDELTYESYNPLRVGKHLYEGVFHIGKYNNVSQIGIDARGQHAAEIISEAPGVITTEYYSSANSLTVTQTALDTMTYSEVQFYCGLAEDGWWLNYSRDHGHTVTFEFRVKPFAPPFPDEKQWSDLAEKISSEDQNEEMTRSTFEYYTQLDEEYNGDRELVRHPEIMNGDPRLAGTGCNALHVYYLTVIRGGDPEDVTDVMYPDMDLEDITYMVEYVEENHREEAEKYAKEATTRLSDTDPEDVDIEDIPEWSPEPGTNQHFPTDE